MKKVTTILLLLFLIAIGYSQDQPTPQSQGHKGKYYVYWGWNRAWYSNSDITFEGSNYDFILKEVVAKDSPSSFNLNTYFNPMNIFVPQYNFRIGYFISDNYNISLGLDHMKYVMQQNQVVKITGYIENSGTGYDGEYSDDEISLTEDFLQFEHTDGLNYVDIEIRRFDRLFNLGSVKVNLTEGLGIGILVPRTNTKLLNKDRYDEFHLAGYGLNGILGINFEVYKSFFIQSELKFGYINMPNIRTTHSDTDSAKQDFYFTQINLVFGITF